MVNALDLLDEELTRIDNEPPVRSGPPLFLWTKNGHQIRLRFLLNLPDVVVLKRHNKYSDNPGERVNAICASEIGQPCSFCELAEHDRLLSAHYCWYTPAHVEWIAVTKDEKGNLLKVNGKPKPSQLTYKNKDNEILPVQGFRVLELVMYGAIGDVLKNLRNYAKDPDYNCDITGNDFVIEHQMIVPPGGKKPKKTLTLQVKPAKPMSDEARDCIPAFDDLRDKILENLAPVVSVVSGIPASNGDYDNSGDLDDHPF